MTAIEYLIQEIKQDRYVSHKSTKEWNDVFRQAKEMEKQQLENCAIYFTNYGIDIIEGKKEINGEKQFEQYYNETFK